MLLCTAIFLGMRSRKQEIIELLKENNKDVFLNYALGLEYLSENNFSDAIHQFEKVIEMDKEYIPAYYQCGMAYIEINNKLKAIENLKKGLQIAIEKQSKKDIAEFKSVITNIENDWI